MVMEVLKNHSWRLNRKKCSFGMVQLEYLDHITSANGILADPQQIKAMEEWPVTKDVKSLGGFFGLMGYYGTWGKFPC